MNEALLTTSNSPRRMAIIGAGPVGLALALLAAQQLPDVDITVFDARSSDQDVSRDPRTLALSLGSVQLLQRLGLWDAVAPTSEALLEVHVSQQQPALVGDMLQPLLDPARAWMPDGLRLWMDERLGMVEGGMPADPCVTISAAEQGVPQLGAVIAYGALVAPLQTAWLQAVAKQPTRLHMRFSAKVGDVLRTQHDGQAAVDIDLGHIETFDLAVIAEGGVFSPIHAKGSSATALPPPLTDPKSLHHDYQQTAWVGTISLAQAHRGIAYERFTPQGPAALLPLPAKDGQHRAALVWCVPSHDDPVQDLTDAQRLTVLNTLFPPRLGAITGLSPFKAFPLGLLAKRSLVDGRRVHIGNAAQTLHPVAGQGLNLGLRDAMELVLALRQTPSIDAALKTVERHRAPDRWAMIATTDFLARSFTWTVPGLTTVRGLGLGALQLASPLKRLIARQMMFGRR